MDLNFQKTVRDKYKYFSDVKEMVLATSLNNHVTSRLVSVACFENHIYFLSWKHHTKCKQISQNPNVSFCHKNLQMIGNATIKGVATSENNSEISRRFESKQPHIYRAFSMIDGMVIVETVITHIKAWEKTETGYFIDYIDIVQGKAFRKRPEEQINEYTNI